MPLNLVSFGPFNFNGFDVVVLIILIISMLYAASRGFMREVVSLLALLFAAIVTLFVWGQFRFDIQGWIQPTWLADGLLIFGVGAFTYLIAVMLFSKIGKTFRGENSGFIDRILGGAFGIARGLVIAALGVMVLTSQHRASQEAQDYRAELEAKGIYDQVIVNMPQSMREQMEAEPKPLPDMFEHSTFYPLLNRIGNAIRALPFAKMRSYADLIKDGELDQLIEEIDK